MSRSIQATVAPFLPKLSTSVDLVHADDFPLAPNRRNRSNDNGRPNGMVGVPVLRPETFPRSFPKTHRAQTRNTGRLSNTAAPRAPGAGGERPRAHRGLRAADELRRLCQAEPQADGLHGLRPHFIWVHSGTQSGHLWVSNFLFRAPF